MISLEGFEYSIFELAGIPLEVAEKGIGRPIVFLSSLLGNWKAEPFLGRLSHMGRLIVPTHPGFGYTDMPKEITSLDDLVYLYLDLLDTLKLQDVLLIGSSFGGWIAAEMAVRDRSRIGGLALIDTLGFKFSGREDRDIADFHNLTGAERARLSYADPETFTPQYGDFDDDELLRAARSWESFALLGWKPYMHNPKLHRRLHRVTAPTLVLWGGEDGIVKESYGRKIAAGIAGAQFEIIEHAGHYPYVEQPDATSQEIERFAGVLAA